MQLHGNQRLGNETSKYFTPFTNTMEGLSPNHFKGFHMNDIPVLEYLLTLNILLYDIDFVDGNDIGKLARRSELKNENTVQLLRYNNHLSYLSNINAVFKYFSCPNCDAFFKRAFNLERTLTTCRERLNNVYHRNVFRN